ncbi:hypothetical protein BuS5_02478 [Desulfosarcina sp. BuS5]|uniref:hypothetical protein n=1 Tax=Desulfosarcina sp. BuS5 TaxID=933262 RepID=UPI000489F940|nr:hypothetical protein [Desulfosarcina sp. BuS5]WDN89510.1 hypothetical protein BuS5_02478 [Desulfosarcina sp. BuS5]
MKKTVFIFAVFFLVSMPSSSFAAEGVAIQRVITNTRSELGQLASSSKARNITELMKKFDTQYETWSSSCGGGENFDPANVSDACKSMASQMRETGILLYGNLSGYLPDVAARYEQGAKSANRIINKKAAGQTPAALYRAAMDGAARAPRLGSLSSQNAESPFDLETDNFIDPTEQMFSVLEKLVPDFGKELPEVVRAGSAQVTMMKKAKRARYLAEKFEKAKFILESQREYGDIIFNATNAVSAMPQVLGLQYTGAGLSARPNAKVIEYYRKKNAPASPAVKEKKIGGFKPRT